MKNRTESEEALWENQEREELKRKWDTGELQRHLPELWKFALDKRSYFHSRSQNTEEIWNTFIELIRSNRSICSQYESIDQAKEIAKELWYASERGLEGRIKIVLDWAETHGRNWRDWRTKEYLFAAEMCKSQILRTLLGH